MTCSCVSTARCDGTNSTSQQAVRCDDRVSELSVHLPLSVESARSVRDASIAIRYHGSGTCRLWTTGASWESWLSASTDENPRPRPRRR